MKTKKYPAPPANAGPYQKLAKGKLQQSAPKRKPISLYLKSRSAFSLPRPSRASSSSWRTSWRHL